MISGPRSWPRRAKSASRSAASKPWRNRISYFQSTLAARSALVLTPPEKARAYGTKGEEWMLKIWGRNTSSNVQKVMWAIGELALEPNGLVPTLQDGDLTLWESNTIVRYLAARYGAGKLEPADWKSRALASQWMDWQLSVVGPAISGAFWGLIRTPPEQRDQAAIATSQAKTTEAMKMFDAALAKGPYAAGAAFSMGDIPVGIMAYRFRQLVPDRPALPNFERWYKDIAARPAFIEHVSSIPLQ